MQRETWIPERCGRGRDTAGRGRCEAGWHGVRCQPPGVGAEMENTDGVWGFGAVSGGGREIVSWVLDTRSLRCLGSTPAEELGVSWCFFPLHCP